MWLAADQAGHVGAFITAGVGPVPVIALEAGQVPIADIEVRLCRLPARSRARLLVSVARPASFVDLAERGLFVYDWSDIHRTAQQTNRVYEPVAVPTEPITASGLPSDLKAIAVALRLSNTVFSAEGGLDVRAMLDCAEPMERGVCRASVPRDDR